MKKTGFFERDDGYWQWDTPALTFLIGSTDETVPYVALWVTSVSVLSYRMVERIRFEGLSPATILDKLKKEAKILLVRIMVIGFKAFFEYTKERQEMMDELISWTSSGLEAPAFIEEVIH